MGTYSDHPDPRVYYQVVDTKDCVRYTDPAEAPWFRDRINWAYSGTPTNVRMEGDTIRWFGGYYLHIGDWLYAGTTPVSDYTVRNSSLRPILQSWPDDPSAPPEEEPPPEEPASEPGVV